MIYTILLPIIAGLICLIIPRLKEALAVLVSLATFILTGILFFNRPQTSSFFVLDNLSGFILLAIGFFGFLIVLYSVKFMAGKSRLKEYYAYILWTIGASCGTVLANNLLLLLIFWGFLGLTLYLLIGIGGPEAAPAAKKTFIIVGGVDALMILGIAIIWHLTGTLEIDKITIPLNQSMALTAFLCLVITVLAKIGANPLHTWIPPTAEKAPIPVVSLLPASLDKLLGIYLIVRVCRDLFIMSQPANLLLIIIGTVTILTSVISALVQNDMKRLLAFLNISAAGYILIALATDTPIGIAGGLFYLVSTCLWTSCLFLCAGAVEQKAGTVEFEGLGGIAKGMPITFTAFLVAGLSISGVPPFNGFFAKWMVYQGIIEMGNGGNSLWPIWLVAAIFGSALTLASFMKLTHAIFLGRGAEHEAQSIKKKIGWTMWVPMVTLAGLCIIFGVFAYQIPLKYLIAPVVANISYTGVWTPGLAATLIIIGIILGLIIYWIGNLKNIRVDTSPFYGGEVLPDEARVTGTDFYNTIKNLGLLKGVYKKAEEKSFDIYDQGRKSILFFSKGLQKVHTGVLTTYLSWILIGLVIIFFILIK